MIDLQHGDCLELMKDIKDKSIDMILCDLPYTFNGKKRVTANDWDLPIDDNQLWEQYERIIKDNGAIALFATNPFASYLISKHLQFTNILQVSVLTVGFLAILFYGLSVLGN